MNILTKMSDTFFRKGDYRNFLLRKLPPKSVGCELGVWKGDFSKEILRIVNPKKLYLVDPWSYQPECSDSWYGGGIARTQKDMDDIYLSVKRLFAKNKNVQIVRKKTEELQNEISDNELDWVYIDGNHQFDYVLQDLHYFSRRVKEGGIICGDDYDRGKMEPYPITEAVKKYLQENRNFSLLWVKKNQFFIQKNL